MKEIKKGAQNKDDVVRVGAAQSTREVVGRYGSANAEYIKGYTGVDKETGRVFSKGLKQISRYKTCNNPDVAAKNIKQQAGFSAEIAATSRDNAEAIISKSKTRTFRSDDLPQYGKNHHVVDRVQVLNGKIVEGSQTQMKFVSNRNNLFKKIAQEDGKFKRYRGFKIELPSEQYEGAAEYCRKQANILRERAERVEHEGKPGLAERFRREANNYDQLAENVKDSGLTTDDIIFYRKHPELATALDIAKTSHRAGMEGAKYGAVIGGAIFLLKNGLSVSRGEKDFGDAAKDFVLQTGGAAAMGYGTAFAGSAIKGAMQQSGNSMMSALSKTNLPTQIVNICLSLGGSVNRYVQGEISEAEFLTEVGEKGAGMLSSGMMAVVGQVVIPVPFIGAAIGGMIGYTLSGLFYQSALQAARGAHISRERLKRIRLIEEAARARLTEEHSKLDAFVRSELPQLYSSARRLFDGLECENTSVEKFSALVNEFAKLLGKRLEFGSIDDFDHFMSSDSPLKL